MMLRTKTIVVGLGLIHFAVMCFFLTGPELAPLVVAIVDSPGLFIAQRLLPDAPEYQQLFASMVICSIAYPLALLAIARRFLFRRQDRD
jgi:hypothetical protein